MKKGITKFLESLLSVNFSKILIICGFLLFFLIFFIKSERLSEYGDFFGGISGVVWSLAGVILFYVALNEQRRDIKINQDALMTQIKEFELQRDESKETRKVLLEQSKTLKLQQFENTFFNMMSLFQEIISNLEFGYSGDLGKGRIFFKVAFRHFKAIVNQYKAQNPDSFLESHVLVEAHISKNDPSAKIPDEDLIKIKNELVIVYNNFYQIQHHNLGHYVSFLMNLFDFLEKSPLNLDEKKIYFTIIKNQFSSYEMALLFYHALRPSSKKLYEWIERYNLLEFIEKDALLLPNIHSQLYLKSKFRFPN